MAAINGTNVASAIRPFDTADTFPTAIANEVKGGLHQVNALSDLYAIPNARREIGMFCWVEAESKLFRLKSNPTGDTTSTNWEEFSSAGDVSKIKMSDGTSLDAKLKKIDQSLYFRSAVLVINPANTNGYGDVELTVPYKASIESVMVSILSSVTLVGDFIIQIEVSDPTTGTWSVLDTVTIPQSTTTFVEIKTLATAKSIDTNTKIRCKILQSQEDMQSAQISINMRLES